LFYPGLRGPEGNALFHLHLGAALRADATVWRDCICAATRAGAGGLSVGRTRLHSDQLDRALRERQLAVRYRTRLPHVGLASRYTRHGVVERRLPEGPEGRSWRAAMVRTRPAHRP